MSVSSIPENSELLEKIREHFDLDELEELCFLLNVPFEELAGETLTARVVSLITYCRRRSLLPALLQVCRQLRPLVSWPDVVPGLPRESALQIYTRESTFAPRLQLIGRDYLVADIDALLDAGRQVLLYGVGGIGKTSVAQAVVKRRLAAGKQPVFWLEVGDRPARLVFDALAAVLDVETRNKLRDLPPDPREWAISELLSEYLPALLVLDNVWNGEALFSILQAAPEGLPVLVTSRQLMAMQKQVQIESLTPLAALAVLSHYAGQDDLRRDLRAVELCRILGSHPYALEIAGAIIRVDGRLTDRRLRTIRENPLEMTSPAGFSDRPSLVNLLQQSYQVLSADAQAVLRAVGALYAPGATPELLASCLGRPPDEVWEALQQLRERSLAYYRAPDDADPNAGVDYYTFHDLTFSFARSLHDVGVAPDIVPAIGVYVATYASSTTLLHLDIANLLAAARHGWANHPDVALGMIANLTTGGYMDVHGHTLDFVALLDRAIEQLRAMDARDPRLYRLLTQRGNAYLDHGDWAKTLALYGDALAAASDDRQRARVMALMGLTHSYQGDQAGEADFVQAEVLAAPLGDDDLTAYILEIRTEAAGVSGDYEAARDYAAREAALARASTGVAPERLPFALNNLGSAEEALGRPEEALHIHTEAYELLARHPANNRLRAHLLFNLGIDLARLDRPDEARIRLEQARDLYRQIGNTTSEMEVHAFMSGLESEKAGADGSN